MNSIIRDYFPTFKLYQDLRGQLMDSLTDQDLVFDPGGENPSLGNLCLEIGEIELAYIESFKNFRLDFSVHHPEPEISESVSRLTAWFRELDEALVSEIGKLSEADVQTRRIDRGEGFRPLPLVQLQIYNEALLIFYGKVSVYLKAVNKTPSERWAHWIG